MQVGQAAPSVCLRPLTELLLRSGHVQRAPNVIAEVFALAWAEDHLRALPPQLVEA